MDNRAIGIFDSGLGGLTALKALRELMPHENLIYFADSGRVPYGSREVSQLRRMAVQDLELVAEKGVKAIIAACGTVSSNAAEELRNFRLPVVGVLEASVREMSRVEGNAPLAVIATEASIRSGAFQRAIEERCPGRELIGIPCPDFVPLIESGHHEAGDSLVTEVVERYLRPVKEKGAAALLLGCTHYGIISEAIGNYLGESVRLISASECAAREMKAYIESSGCCGGCGELSCYTSGKKADFDEAASLFLGGERVSACELPVMEVD